MSEDNEDLAEIIERYESFVRNTLMPLFTGGQLIVDQPLTPGMYTAFSVARSADLDVDLSLYGAICRESEGLAPTDTIPWPDAGFMAMAMAIHNILAVTDPLLDRAFARNSREKMLDWADWLLQQITLPMTRGEALMRHALLTRTLGLRRKDIYARSLGTTSRYLGRPESTGFWTKPRFATRRVEEPTIANLWTELRSEDLEVWTLVGKMVQASPITRILRVEAGEERLLGTAELAVLSDDLLRNGLANQIVQGRLRSGDWWDRSITTMVEIDSPRSLVYYPIALCVEVAAIVILARPNDAYEFFGEGGAGACFLAYLNAALGGPPRLDFFREFAPQDLAMLRAWAARWQRGDHEGQSLDPALLERARRNVNFANPPQLQHERAVMQHEGMT